MTEVETRKIIASMMVSFSNYKPVDVGFAVKEWTKYLANYTYEQVSLALKEYILTEKTGFAPSIGQITNLVNKQTETAYYDGLEEMLLANSGRSIETGNCEIPMSEKFKERLEDKKNE